MPPLKAVCNFLADLPSQERFYPLLRPSGFTGFDEHRPTAITSLRIKRGGLGVLDISFIYTLPYLWCYRQLAALLFHTL
jgi:hypothetical protein